MRIFIFNLNKIIYLFIYFTILHSYRTLGESSYLLKNITFPVTQILCKPGSIIDPIVGRFQNYYTFRVTSSVGQYDIIGRINLLQAKHDFEVIYNSTKGKTSSHLLTGMKDTGEYLVSGFSDFIRRPQKSFAGIFESTAKFFNGLQDENALDELLSDSIEKREIASKFALNVYSLNPEVQSFIKLSAEKRNAGKVIGKALTLLTSFTPIGALISIAALNGQSENYLKNLSPAEIIRLVKKRLKAMQVPKDKILSVLKSKYLTPRIILYFTTYMEELKSVTGITLYPLTLLALAKNRLDVDNIYNQMQLYSNLNKSKRIAEMSIIKDLLVVSLKKNFQPLLILPFDYMDLSDKNKEYVFELKKRTVGKCSIRCAGSIDEDMKNFLIKKRVKFKEEILGEYYYGFYGKNGQK